MRDALQHAANQIISGTVGQVIVGLQNGAALYNTYVNGTIGGSGSQNVGGLVGERISGDLKVLF